MIQNRIITLLEERERVIKTITSGIDSYSYATKLIILELIHQSDRVIYEFLESGDMTPFDNVVHLNLYPLRRIDKKILIALGNPELEKLVEYIQIYRRRNNYFPKAITKLKQACDRLD